MTPKFDEAFRAEVQLVASLLKHPAGFDTSLFGLLEVRPTDQGVYEVAWDRDFCNSLIYWRTESETRWRLYKSPLRAAVVFCYLRRALELGVDYEIAAFNES